MKFLLRLLKQLWITSWYAFAIFAVFAAVSLNVARLFFPILLEENSVEIEAKISKLIGQRVKIGGLDAVWQGFGPRLVLENVRLQNEKGTATIARFQSASLGFDLFAYLKFGRLGLSSISLSGLNLYIEKRTDGSIAVAGIDTQVSQSSQAQEGTLERFILSQVLLEIKETDIFWRDARSGNKAMHFNNVNFKLRNQGDRHQLDGSVTLPIELGKQFSFAMDIAGNPLQPTGWNGLAYIKGQSMNVAEMLDGQAISNIHVKSGRANFRLWSHWENGNIVKLSGNVAAKDFLLQRTNSNKKPIRLSYVASQILWKKKNVGWRIDLNRFVLERNGDSWPTTSISMRNNSVDSVKNPDFDVSFSFLRVQDFTSVLLLSPHIDVQFRDAIMRLQPKGDLRKSYIRYKKIENSMPEVKLITDFDGLSFARWDEIPGVKNFSGSINTNETSGSLVFNSREIDIDYPKLFRQNIVLDRLAGNILWSNRNGAIHLSSDELVMRNSDLYSRAKFDLDLPDSDASPFLNLVVAFQNGNAQNVSKYLPVTHLSKNTVEWLDNAIVAGDIRSGGVLFHGKVRDFPFDNGQGKFVVNAKVSNGVLDYLKGWPDIRNIDGELVINGRNLQVLGDAAQIYKSDLSEAVVEIPDLSANNPILKIKGKVQGPTEDKLRYLRTSPELRILFGKSLDDIYMNGSSLLNLNLVIPLKPIKGEVTVVAGDVTFTDNSFELPGTIGEVLSKLNGILKFNNDGMEGEALTALTFGHLGRLDVHTRDQGENRIANFKLFSKMTPNRVVQQFVPAWSDFFKGETQWNMSLDIPIRQIGLTLKPELIIETKLDDVEIGLPPPLAKSVGQKIDVSVNVELSERQHVVDIRYGDQLSTILQFGISKKGTILKRGMLVCGKGKAILPRGQGLRITGALNHFSYDNWSTLVNNAFEKISKQDSPSSININTLSGINIKLDTVEALGQTYRDMSLNALKLGEEWEIKIQSDQLSGNITLPMDYETSPLVMVLENWHLNPGEGSDGPALDPRKLPAISIFSKKFTFKNMQMGQFSLLASRTRGGLTLNRFEFAPPKSKINGVGRWVSNGKEHRTQFDFKLASKNIGETMTTFGFADTVKGGSGIMTVKVSWPDTPSRMSFENMEGKVNIEIENGRLLDLNPGAGRIFGLLSVAALPRRLTLDFSDVFAKGFAFDSIKGDFEISGGDAYTSNFGLSGPSARVAAFGRVGLLDKDYDQKIVVIPDVSAPVPVLSSVVASIPAAAATTVTAAAATVAPPVLIAAFVLKKIFQTQIDNAVSYQYTVTGSWQNPIIERVENPKIEEFEEKL